MRDYDRQPGLYVRVLLTGTEFPGFDSLPFVRIGKAQARFVDIADDRASVRAYFDTAPPARGHIEFGYDDQVLLRFARGFQRPLVTLLDEQRLPDALRYQGRLMGGASGPG